MGTERRSMVMSEKEKRKQRVESAKRISENPKGDSRKSRRISEDVKDRVWNRDGGECVQCGSNENLEFDQLILEFYNPKEGANSGWVHCSHKKDGSNRRKIMTAMRINKKTVYKSGFVLR